MPTSARVALRPYNEASRPSAKGRPTTNFINISSETDSALALRTQRLRRLGIIGGRANLIAGMAWGEVRNG